MPPNNKSKSKARPGTKAKVNTNTKNKKLSREETESDSSNITSNITSNATTDVVNTPSDQKINPTQVNPADLEEIGELINTEIEEDEEWDDDDDVDEDTDDEYDVGDDDAEADECAYEVTRVKKIGLNLADIDSDTDLDDDDFDDPNILETGDDYKRIVQPSERITSPMITKYEKVRLLCDRTTQLALGAKPMIRGIEQINHYDREKMVAQLEFEARVIPIIIERERPDGVFEEWRLSELKYKENMIVYGKDAFTDPTKLVINPEYLKKRSNEIQKGGNITGFTKVESAQQFDNNFLKTLVDNF